MARVRISTTVDGDLLEKARRYRDGLRDADLIDEALAMLVDQEREAEIDRNIAEGYAKYPVDTPDEWGVLPDWIDAMREAIDRMRAEAGEVEDWEDWK